MLQRRKPNDEDDGQEKRQCGNHCASRHRRVFPSDSKER